MRCELVASPRPRRPLCPYCARLDIRDIRVAGRPQVSYTCGLHVRAPRVDRCAFYLREPGADDDRQRTGRWRVVGTAH
jgi:hypothetical protein